MKKADAELDLWLKDVAPSPDLRAAWHADPKGHDTEHFEAFATDYRSELGHDPAASALAQLVQLAQQSTRLTLVYGAKDEKVNHVVVLRDVLLEHLQSASTSA